MVNGAVETQENKPLFNPYTRAGRGSHPGPAPTQPPDQDPARQPAATGDLRGLRPLGPPRPFPRRPTAPRAPGLAARLAGTLAGTARAVLRRHRGAGPGVLRTGRAPRSGRVMAKHLASRYVGKRSSCWLKIKPAAAFALCHHRLGAWRPGACAGSMVAAPWEGQLRYVANVTTKSMPPSMAYPDSTSCWSTVAAWGACVLLAGAEAMTFSNLRQARFATASCVGTIPRETA